MRKLFATLAFGGLLAFGAPEAAEAQVVGNLGLVNVTIVDSLNDVVDVTISDVNIAVAVDVAAQVCGVQVGPVGILANQVARTGQATACVLPNGDRVIIQR